MSVPSSTEPPRGPKTPKNAVRGPIGGVPAAVAHNSTHPTAPADVHDPLWRTALDAVIAEPHRLELHVQPVVDTAHGSVAGYEALSRFSGPFTATPDRWFNAAETWGVNAQLQGRVVAAALGLRRRLPPDTFLTVNIDPHLLPVVYDEVLAPAGDLGRLVLELTEHTQPAVQSHFDAALRAARQQGALIAIDDAGTGYSGLAQLLSVRPDIVKLDRELVSGIDADPVKAAMVATIGDLVGRMDAWVLAEGAETLAELDALVGLGVPLVQGYVLARPAADFVVELPEKLVTHLRATSARCGLGEHVASLVRPAAATHDPQHPDAPVLLGEDGRIKAVRLVVSAHASEVPHAGAWTPAVVVAPADSITDVARRCATRPARDGATPLVCTNGQGHLLGVVSPADLLLALAAGHAR
ncbi:EAL domain-containing protein [Quadrisphaera sp. KR29]|uniref:EAL domain-containing protein n=1 Tax=Quadrisphaera sp. KR29 TaxID=3461391 RepID=UPI004043B92E